MSRPFTSKRFRRSATLIRQEPGGDNEYDEWVPGQETRTDITVVIAPPRRREDSGCAARRSAALGVEVKPVRVGTGATEGDVIEYKGTRYRVNQVEQWPGFVEVLGVREEGQ